MDKNGIFFQYFKILNGLKLLKRRIMWKFKIDFKNLWFKRFVSVHTKRQGAKILPQSRLYKSQAFSKTHINLLHTSLSVSCNIFYKDMLLEYDGLTNHVLYFKKKKNSNFFWDVQRVQTRGLACPFSKRGKNLQVL